jgi:hypothetical protein
MRERRAGLEEQRAAFEARIAAADEQEHERQGQGEAEEGEDYDPLREWVRCVFGALCSFGFGCGLEASLLGSGRACGGGWWRRQSLCSSSSSSSSRRRRRHRFIPANHPCWAEPLSLPRNLTRLPCLVPLLSSHSPPSLHHSTTCVPIRYINWLQEAYPSDGAEATLLLERCARRFQDDVRYKQDPRYLKASYPLITALTQTQPACDCDCVCDCDCN